MLYGLSEQLREHGRRWGEEVGCIRLGVCVKELMALECVRWGDFTIAYPVVPHE